MAALILIFLSSLSIYAFRQRNLANQYAREQGLTLTRLERALAEAKRQEEIAIEQRKLAEEQTRIAEKQRAEAVQQRQVAEQQRAEAGAETTSFSLINQFQAEVFSLRDKVGNQ